ncbi:hypothetical protein DEO72_LG1g2630 [Vigna unguiculata]|uniref:Uncharacterized protein n=1 Tax=Vigna unguiculata TaxID=3917 RepID=A0A4D6KR27_VIGUN|nr:hypothetical protein DEO72_LG1g2630 [Vigna unguiculata]
MVLQNRGRREDDGAAMKLVLALHSRGDGDDDGAAMEMKVEDGCCYWSRCVAAERCGSQIWFVLVTDEG